MTEQSDFLGMSDSFSPAITAVVLLATLYTGVFLMVSNHYVFKPKVENFLVNSSIESKALQQIIIDFLTTLPHLIFALCTVLLQKSNNGLSVMLVSDSAWSGLLMAVLAFKALVYKEEANWRLILVKNIVFLELVYVTLGLHYFAATYLITVGVVLLLLYLINLLLNAYEQKFVGAMEYLFEYKQPYQPQESHQKKNLLPNPEFLARRFSVTAGEINKKYRDHEAAQSAADNKNRSPTVTKLLKIALAIRLSRQKMERRGKKEVKYYFGSFNGTVTDNKSKKVIIDREEREELMSNESEGANGEAPMPEQSFDSFIFYIFPVHLLEGNKALSMLFSLVLNLGFGMLLAVALHITSTVSYSQYFHFIYGFLLLPLLPSVSKQEFMSSMTLSSLWKYCLFGIFLIIHCAANSSTTFEFVDEVFIPYISAIQAIALVAVTIMLMGQGNALYSIFFVWLFAAVLTCFVIFKKS